MLAGVFSCPAEIFGSVFGKGGEETGTSSLLLLSLLDSLKEISHVQVYELRR